MPKSSMDEKKDFLSKHAAKVFSEKGYQLASLQDIARSAKISKAGVYHYFKTKDDILAYILLRNTDIFLADLKAGIKECEEMGLPPERLFFEVIKKYAQLVNSNRAHRSIVLRERHQLTGKNKKELLRREKEMFHLLKEKLELVNSRSKKIDPNVVTFLLIAMSHWVGYWYKEGKKLDLDQIIEQNIWVILNGIMKNSNPKLS